MKRECGSCQLCCKLLPMKEYNKPAGVRCQHQRHHIGCHIYPRRPMPCQVWTCRWLNGDNTGQRPDHAHYVVDIMPDYVTLVPHDGSPPVQAPVLQVWVDPAYPDAHRAPKLRRFLEEQAMAALIRMNAQQGFVIAPPNVSADGKWFEGTIGIGARHTARGEARRDRPLRMTLELASMSGACSSIRSGAKRQLRRGRRRARSTASCPGCFSTHAIEEEQRFVVFVSKHLTARAWTPRDQRRRLHHRKLG